MNKMKYFSLLTAGSLIVTSMPANVLADTAAESGVVYYTVDAVESSGAVDAETEGGELFGRYSADVSLETETGSFSLIADEGSAVISVDEDGSMTVEFNIENGGESEPVYVLAFNGYYSENDKDNELVQADVTMAGIEYSDDVVTDGAVVVTSVKLPLEGEKTDTYAANVTLYAPELSDEVGIENENGVFTTDCCLTIDWDSLEKITGYKFGSEGAFLEFGTYTLPVSLKSVDNLEENSIAESAVVNAELTVNEDGSAAVKVYLTYVTVDEITDWAYDWKIYNDDDTLSNVVETLNEDGYVDAIEFNLSDNSLDGVYLNMYVEAIGSSIDAYLDFDFSNAELVENETEEDTEDETDDLTVDEDSAEESTEEDTEETTESASEETTVTTTTKRTSSGSGGSLTVNGYTSTAADEEEADDDESDEASIFHNVQVKIGSKSVVIDGEEYTMEIAPYIQSSSSSTMVPLRFVALAISGGSVDDADSSKNVSWDADTKTATIKANGSVIKFTAGSDIMIVDGEEIVMEYGVEAEIKSARMFVPFRALGNALGVDVDWDADTKTATYN